jgi:heme A synthase
LAWLLAGLTLLQFALGALVVIGSVPLRTAIAHQACAFIMLSVAVALAHAQRASASYEIAELTTISPEPI